MVQKLALPLMAPVKRDVLTTGCKSGLKADVLLLLPFLSAHLLASVGKE